MVICRDTSEGMKPKNVVSVSAKCNALLIISPFFLTPYTYACSRGNSSNFRDVFRKVCWKIKILESSRSGFWVIWPSKLIPHNCVLKLGEKEFNQLAKTVSDSHRSVEIRKPLLDLDEQDLYNRDKVVLLAYICSSVIDWRAIYLFKRCVLFHYTNFCRFGGTSK